MIAPEHPPGPDYLRLYDAALARNGARLAGDVASLAAHLADRAGHREVVIASLARAGTPIGVLLLRTLRTWGIRAVHYSLSIIRDRGIDRVALARIAARHDPADVIFVDGWTGKGAIAAELRRSLADWPMGFAPTLAVVADPAGQGDIAAAADDYLIASGLLNGIVSGLVSRSILSAETVGPGDYHAWVAYPHFAAHDRSRAFVDAVAPLAAAATPRPIGGHAARRPALIAGCEAMLAEAMARVGVPDRNRVKPGIAEATRALLRRVPDRLFLRDPADPDVAHLTYLADAAGVRVDPLGEASRYRAVAVIAGLLVTIDALGLGATLYLPATRPDLAAVLSGGRIPGLRSAVLCVEDAVLDADVPRALAHLSAFLRTAPPTAPALFVRPRDVSMLHRILRMPGAERLAGFVLPKVGPDTLPAWLQLPFLPKHRLMPTLETRDAFDPFEMRRLREQLLAVHDRILLLRIGGNDLLQALGVRRSPARTAYEGPLGPVIAALVGTFAPWGFALSAPVMERYDDPVLLREEVARDIEHGLLTKTAIHPAQVPVIHGALAVPPDQAAEARAILADDAPAVFGAGGAMCEPATHRRWAELIVRRAALFGVADPLPAILPIARHA